MSNYLKAKKNLDLSNRQPNDGNRSFYGGFKFPDDSGKGHPGTLNLMHGDENFGAK